MAMFVILIVFEFFIDIKIKFYAAQSLFFVLYGKVVLRSKLIINCKITLVLKMKFIKTIAG